MEANEINHQHSENVLTSFFIDTVVGFIQIYGWLLLFTCIIGFLVWNKILSKFRSWQQTKETEKFFAAYHQDPNLALARQEALEASRKRLQEHHDAQAELFKTKLQQKEEDKRREKINEWEKLKEGASYYSKYKLLEHEVPKTKPIGKSKPKLKNDYNPLMGSAGTSYRPSRSECNSGG